MNTILVPTDFSDGAFNALGYAIRLAELLDYSIQVVHAYSMPPTGSAVMVDITEILEKNALEELELLKRKVEKINLPNVTITYKPLHGSVVEVINRMSRTEGIEFVVMGTQGASGITEKWLGTNAASAAKNVEDPLMIVPSNHVFKNIGHILFATDLKVTENDKHLRFLATLTSKSNAKLDFLHIRKHSEESDDDKIGKFRNQLDRIFGEGKTRITYLFDNEVNEGIQDGIETHNPDVLVVVRHAYGFFEGLFRSSVSRKLISESALPILVLQDK